MEPRKVTKEALSRVENRKLKDYTIVYTGTFQIGVTIEAEDDEEAQEIADEILSEVEHSLGHGDNWMELDVHETELTENED